MKKCRNSNINKRVIIQLHAKKKQEASREIQNVTLEKKK